MNSLIHIYIVHTHWHTHYIYIYTYTYDFLIFINFFNYVHFLDYAIWILYINKIFINFYENIKRIKSDIRSVLYKNFNFLYFFKIKKKIHRYYFKLKYCIKILLV